MTKPQNIVLVWHYTTGDKMESIWNEGVLRPTNLYIGAREVPVVWFSMNQVYERTAAKGIKVDGSWKQVRAATLEEMHELVDGVYRIGVPPRGLLGGDALRRKAKIEHKTWAGLASSAKAMGANATDWWGSLTAVPLEDCVIEVLTDELKWIPFVQYGSPESAGQPGAALNQ
jgi:hypothetical protein